MNWTDERVKLLETLWNDGVSASQIALHLGKGISRNAVIGKVHRLKLSGRGKDNAPESAKKTVSSVEKSIPSSHSEMALDKESLGTMNLGFAASPLALEEPSPEPIPVEVRSLSLLQLSEVTCKWPLGDPLSEEFCFCGADVASAGPYCSYHAQIAYQNISDRKKLR